MDILVSRLWRLRPKSLATWEIDSLSSSGMVFKPLFQVLGSGQERPHLSVGKSCD